MCVKIFIHTRKNALTNIQICYMCMCICMRVFVLVCHNVDQSGSRKVNEPICLFFSLHFFLFDGYEVLCQHFFPFFLSFICSSCRRDLAQGRSHREPRITLSLALFLAVAIAKAVTRTPSASMAGSAGAPLLSVLATRKRLISSRSLVAQR